MLGIALVNVQMMSAPVGAFQGELRLWADPLNATVQAVVRFFFESTAFVLFSLLFGVGFGRLMQRRAETGAGTGPYWRRLGALGGLGILHITFLWFGDVLLLYAIAGVLLLAFRTCRERTLWIWIGGLLVVPMMLLLGAFGLIQLASAMDEEFASGAWAAEEQQWMAIENQELVLSYSQGSFGEVMEARLDEYLDTVWELPFFGALILAAMLLGLILARRGVLEKPERHDEFFRRLLWIVLPIAVVGKGVYVASVNRMGFVPDAAAFIALGSSAVGGMAMALVYVCLLRLVWLRGWASRLVVHVAAAGRMALTHYLGQSLIATTLFYSYGLGWYGRIQTWQAMALMIVIYALQIAVSPWWFRRFSFGPLEALVRRVSYGRARPPALPPPLPQ
ncbi:MAG: DUF418 domain-containing protein [Rariglobus sp.]